LLLMINITKYEWTLARKMMSFCFFKNVFVLKVRVDVRVRVKVRRTRLKRYRSNVLSGKCTRSTAFCIKGALNPNFLNLTINREKY